jgi:hypothetical protein
MWLGCDKKWEKSRKGNCFSNDLVWKWWILPYSTWWPFYSWHILSSLCSQISPCREEETVWNPINHQKKCKWSEVSRVWHQGMISLYSWVLDARNCLSRIFLLSQSSESNEISQLQIPTQCWTCNWLSISTSPFVFSCAHRRNNHLCSGKKKCHFYMTSWWENESIKM